jgi:peptide-methionine (S)-S-oxide reductase
MVGYTGGPNTTPTYASVCSGDGHIETVRLVFDPKLVTYEQLLNVFMQDEQPTLAGQYQSVLWPRSESQRAAAESRLGSLAEGDQRTLVSMRPAETFFPAEEYHDKYLAKQGPRNFLLAVSLLGTLWPQLPLSASDAQTIAALVPGWLAKAPAACSIAYLAIFIVERALDRGKEPIV